MSLPREAVPRWGDPHAIGASLRELGLVTRGREREQLLRDAVSVLSESEGQLEHAHALVDLGAELRREPAQRGAGTAAGGRGSRPQVGAIGLAERANEELAATVSGRARSCGWARCAEDKRAAGCAAGAEGRSNKEIAQALFVTVKTVEVHLSSTYRKLEIGSRAQLEKALVAAAPVDAAAVTT